MYFSLKKLNSDSYTFYAGDNDASGNLTNGILTSYGTSEANAATNKWTTVKDSAGKSLAILPSNVEAKFIRIHIEDGSNVAIWEFKPSTYFSAHEIVTGELHITDALSQNPLIRVTKSSVDRIKIGNFTGTTYGIIGYNALSATLFELSDAAQTIAGWTFNASELYSDAAVYINAATPKITFGGDLTYLSATGIFMGKDVDATYKLHIGNPAGDHLKFDGTNLTVSGTIGGIITGTTADTFTVNSDLGDVSAGLILGRTTGGSATLGWNGTTVSLDKLLTLTGNLSIQNGSTSDGALAIGDGSASINRSIYAWSNSTNAATPGGIILRNSQHGANTNFQLYAENDAGTLHNGTVSFDPDGFLLGFSGSGSETVFDLVILSTGLVGFGCTPSALIHGIDTTEQLRLGYDAAGYFNITVSDGGSTSLSTVTDNATGNLTLAPVGDILINPTGNDVNPVTNYDINLGSLSKKYLTLHAAELWVETLVAQNTIATIGGRILVGPTTILTSDFGSGETTITVKHNEMASGDRIYMEANGKLEFMSVDSAAGGAGPYTYTVTRNLDGSGANDWFAGDAVFNTGTTGDGFIDIFSVQGVHGSGAGPTIIGNVRNSATYNDYTEHWAIGNLNGVYGYSSDIYGVAFGEYSESDYITIDSTNGIQFKDASDSVRAQLNAAVWTLGNTSTEHISISATSVQIKDGATVLTDLTAGVLTLGNTANEYVKISTSGFQVYDGASLYATYGATTTIGLTASEHISISSAAVQFKDGATVLTDISGGNILVGQTGAGQSNVYITSGAVNLRTNTTNFLTLDTSGVIFIGNSDNEYVKVSSSGFQIYDGATLLATYAASTTFYDTNGADRLVLGTTGITVGDVTEGEYITIASTGLQVFGGAIQTVQISNDGSGWLAGNGKLNWDASGNITMTASITLSNQISSADISDVSANADQTSANTASNAANYTGAEISTTYTAAKATDATANNTSTALNASVTITGGGITINGGGNIKGGQTDYATGTGFFLGYSTAYKFSIGDADSYLKWTGGALDMKFASGEALTIAAGGDIILTGSDADAATIQWSHPTAGVTQYIGARSTDDTLCFWPASDPDNRISFGWNANTDALARYVTIDMFTSYWVDIVVGAAATKTDRLDLGGANDVAELRSEYHNAGLGKASIVLDAQTAAISQAIIYTSGAARVTVNEDGTVSFAQDIILANANTIGIGPALERLEFYTAGYAAFMGCSVGIGTVTTSGIGASAKLEVNGGNVNIVNSGGQPQLYIGDDGNNYINMSWEDTYGRIQVYDAGVVAALALNPAGGNVGIWETGPQSLLHITNGDTGQTNNTSNFILESTGTNYLTFLADAGESSYAGINWDDGAITASIKYQHSTNIMLFAVSAANELRLDSTSLSPVSAGGLDLGTDALYFTDINYKTLDDRGCLGSFDNGVELQNGIVVSDLEAIMQIQTHPTKLTVFGLPALDYRSLPKPIYIKAGTRSSMKEWNYFRDENDEPYAVDKDGEKHEVADGAELSSLVSLILGGLKEENIKVEALKLQVKELQLQIGVIK